MPTQKGDQHGPMPCRRTATSWSASSRPDGLLAGRQVGGRKAGADPGAGGQVVSAWAVNSRRQRDRGSGCTADRPDQPPSDGAGPRPVGSSATAAEPPAWVPWILATSSNYNTLHPRRERRRARHRRRHEFDIAHRRRGIRHLVRRRARLPARLPPRTTATRTRSRTTPTRARSPRCLADGRVLVGHNGGFSVPRTAGASSSSFRSWRRSEAAAGVPERSRRAAPAFPQGLEVAALGGYTTPGGLTARRPDRRGPEAQGQLHLGRERRVLLLAPSRRRDVLGTTGRAARSSRRRRRAPRCST